MRIQINPENYRKQRAKSRSLFSLAFMAICAAFLLFVLSNVVFADDNGVFVFTNVTLTGGFPRYDDGKLAPGCGLLYISSEEDVFAWAFKQREKAQWSEWAEVRFTQLLGFARELK